MKVDHNEGHADSCACLRPGDSECNCHKAYGFDTAEQMEQADKPVTAPATPDGKLPERILALLEKHGGWQAVIDALEQREAEVASLRGDVAFYCGALEACKDNRAEILSQATAAESRLGEAEKLLRDCEVALRAGEYMRRLPLRNRITDFFKGVEGG